MSKIPCHTEAEDTDDAASFEIGEYACPHCGKRLLRLPKTDGSYFWGCSAYEADGTGCDYTLNDSKSLPSISAVHAVPGCSAVLPQKRRISGGVAVPIPVADKITLTPAMNPVSLRRIMRVAGTNSERTAMTHESHSLMDRISVLVAGEEISLSLADAITAGLFIENALSVDDAADSFFSGEASHG